MKIPSTFDSTTTLPHYKPNRTRAPPLQKKMDQQTTTLLTLLLVLYLSSAHGRVHHHKPRRRHHHPIWLSPTPPPTPPPGVDDNATLFNVLSFGAIGDGLSDDTNAFRTAWDFACQVQDATILVPEGHTFLLQSAIFPGPCQSGLHFQIDGVLTPPDGPAEWPTSISRRQWLVFYRADGLTLHGGGLVDGRGKKWWELPCKPHRGKNGTTMAGPCDSPVALRFFTCGNITVRGLTVINSPQFHFRFDGCRNVVVDGITIAAPPLSPNTDGIHVENTISAAISNSIISNGDDCVSIGSGSVNVLINNVTCGPSHGISIGSLGKQKTRACVSKVRVTNTTIKYSDNGLRIKTWQGGAGSVSAVAFEDVYMDTVRNPIIIDQYYCPMKPCANETGAVLVYDVSYTNIKGTYDVRSPPMHFGCSDDVPCTNITLSDVDLLPAAGDVILDPFCWNAYGDATTPTVPPVSCLLDGLPRTVMSDEEVGC